MRLKDSKEGTNPKVLDVEKPINEKMRLHRQTWRNWFFVTGVLILTTIGLATALPPLLSERILNPWPWVKTDLVLIIGLSITVLIFIAYMTQQQRQVMDLQQELEETQIRNAIKHRQNEERLMALASMSRIMGATTDIQRIFDAITDICSETFHSNRVTLMLIDQDDDYLVVKSARGSLHDEIMNRRRRIGEGISGCVAERREAVLLNSREDSASFPDMSFKDPSINSAMVTPIIVRDELVGVINVSSQSPEVRYEQEDLKALEVLAYNAGVCIRHLEHINWIKKIGPTLRNLESRKQVSRI